MKHKIQTAGSVREEQLEKIAGQIYRTILVADPVARISCEINPLNSKIIILGEVSIGGDVDIDTLISEVTKAHGLDISSFTVSYSLEKVIDKS